MGDCNRWRFGTWPDQFYWITPWFYVDVSVGGYDPRYDGLSWHLRLEWRRNQDAKAGDELFQRRKEWLFRQTQFRPFRGF